MEEKERYRKKIKIYKALGAEKFQDVVFAFERFKFKAIDKLFPNLLTKLEKRVDKNMKKRLEMASSPEEGAQIIEEAKLTILTLRKEFNTRKNINYHMDRNNPTEIIDYLNLNKKIHKNKLIMNGVLSSLAILGIIFQIPGAIFLLVIEGLSGILNFECVNIQNYNLCRIERIKDKLEKRRARRIKEEEKNSEACDLIYDSVMQEEKLPSMREIIERAETPDQLEQLKNMLLQEFKSRGIQLNEGSSVK